MDPVNLMDGQAGWSPSPQFSPRSKKGQEAGEIAKRGDTRATPEPGYAGAGDQVRLAVLTWYGPSDFLDAVLGSPGHDSDPEDGRP